MKNLLFISIVFTTYHLASMQSAFIHEYEKQKENNSPCINTFRTATFTSNDLQFDSMCREVNQSDITNQRPEYTLPAPIANTKSIDMALAKSVLKHAPDDIKDIVDSINSLENKNDIADAKFTKQWIFVGPSGTGKTTIGKAIAAECGLPFFMYSGTTISNEYQNSGPANLERIFANAIDVASKQNIPCIIIIDEIGELFNQYSNKNNRDCSVATLWQLLDKHIDSPILFIGTLNDASPTPNPLEDRFCDDIIEVPFSNEEQRQDLIIYYMGLYPNFSFDKDCTNSGINTLPVYGGIPISFCEELHKVLARKTKNFSHRKLGILIKRSTKIAKKRHSNIVELDDCLQALAHIQKSQSWFEHPWAKTIRVFFDKWGQTIFSINGLLNTAISLHGIHHQLENASFQRSAHKENMDAQQ